MAENGKNRALKPIYILVRGDEMIGGPYRYKWIADGYRYDGEEVIEVLPTDQGYDELLGYMTDGR